MEKKTYESFDNTWISVTVEMDLGRLHYERNVYTIFDMLADVGGLNGILIIILSLLSAIWNYNSFDNFMVSRLFKIHKPDGEFDSEDEYFSKSEYIKLGNYPFIKDWLQSWMPSICNCCKYIKFCR